MACIPCNSECCAIDLGVTKDEVENILFKFKGIYDDYFKKYNSTISVVKRPNGKCIFLNKQNKCKIYLYRPNRCRIYEYPQCEVLGVKIHG
jgi:Fe-S-cluster containining protein